jgi:hypothetical protein
VEGAKSPTFARGRQYGPRCPTFPIIFLLQPARWSSSGFPESVENLSKPGTPLLGLQRRVPALLFDLH